MWIVIEWNGYFEGITLSLDEDGNPRAFNMYQEAVEWARANCAFAYKVVNLNGKE